MKYIHVVSKKVWIFCVLVSIAVIFTACGETAPDGFSIDSEGYYRADSPVAMAIILGNHANAMAFPEDVYQRIENSLDDVVYGGYVCVIVADATPTKVEVIKNGEENTFFAESARNPVTLVEYIKNRKKTVIESLKTIGAADTEEVDLLASIREAKNSLVGSRANGIADKRIIIVDTGISTIGDLNFTDIDFLRSRPDVNTIVDHLKSYEGIGVLLNLSGISVTFIGTSEGLAEVGGPQEAGTTDKKYIRELWEAIIWACGADDVKFESEGGWETPNVYTEDEESEFPYVTVIPFFHEKVIPEPVVPSFSPGGPDDPPSMPSPPPLVSVEIRSEMVGFKPDSANYQNENAAKRILEPYAEELSNYFDIYPNEKIWVVGTTATTTIGGDGDLRLSLYRAETVKNTLIDFGIPEDNLLTIGLGAKFPWYVDAFSNGYFDTVTAQANRAVWLLNTNEDNEKFNSLKEACIDGELLQEAEERFRELYP